MQSDFKSARDTASHDDDDTLYSMDVVGDETYREYDWFDPVTGAGRVYRINAPKTVEYRLGGTTHRVTDADDVTHILPAPGFYGCAIRIKNRRSEV